MNWIVLNSLNEIYYKGRTKTKQNLVEDADIRHLIDVTGELKDEGEYIVGGADFKSYYEKHHMSNYELYGEFLAKNKLLKPQTRFEEKDILILMKIKQGMDNGDLVELRNQIIEADETVRGISHMYFRNEKYLENKPSLVEAVRSILDVGRFANEKDQQYIYKLECYNPKFIVLCENLDFLMKPVKPRQFNVELWYAGGWNIDKLNYADTRGFPIFYSCDWDLEGLSIFKSVHNLFPSITLLYPTGSPKGIEETDHDSEWIDRHDLDYLSGLDKNIFSSKEQALIRELIANNQWIIEETNDLITMMKNIGFLN